MDLLIFPAVFVVVVLIIGFFVRSSSEPSAADRVEDLANELGLEYYQHIREFAPTKWDSGPASKKQLCSLNDKIDMLISHMGLEIFEGKEIRKIK